MVQEGAGVRRSMGLETADVYRANELRRPENRFRFDRSSRREDENLDGDCVTRD